MKVLCITDQSDRPETELIIGLAKQVDLTVMCNPKGRFFHLLEEAEVKIKPLVVKGKFDKTATQTIKKQLHSNNYDLVQTFNSKALACALRAGKKHTAKILGYRGVTTNVSYWQPENWITFLSPRLDGVFCVAEAVRQYLLTARFLWLKPDPKKLRTLHKGHRIEWYSQEPADLTEYKIPKSAKVICCLSRNSVHKGVNTLLDAFDQLNPNLNLHLMLVGNINKNKQAQKRVENCKHPERVHFTGYSNNPIGLIKASSLLVSASESGEGLPRVVIEAMASNRPVIATDTGGTNEVVENNVNGLLIPKNNPLALTKAIEEVISNPEAAEKRCEQAIATINTRLNADQTLKNTLEWYQELTGLIRI